MVESTVPRKLGAASAATIDSAVVSSVRRDLFCDRSKSRRTARSFAVDRELEFTFSFPFIEFLTT